MNGTNEGGAVLLPKEGLTGMAATLDGAGLAGPVGNEIGMGDASVLGMDTCTPAFAAVVAKFLVDQTALRARMALIGQEGSQEAPEMPPRAHQGPS